MKKMKNKFLKLGLTLFTMLVLLASCTDEDETKTCNCTRTTTSDGEVLSTTTISLESIPGSACAASNSTVNSTVGDISVTVKTVCD